jgi:hypothetical protein
MTKLNQLCDQFISNPQIPDHISPSQVNNFLGNKMSFVGRLLNFERRDNINFQKGNTVERAVNLYLGGLRYADDKSILTKEAAESCKGDIKQSISLATEVFTKEASSFSSYAEIAESIAQICEKAINRYAPFKDNITCQDRVQGLICDNFILGYTDYQTPSTVYDCKITGKTPSSMPQSHKNAAYMYHTLTGKTVVYDYFIPLKKEMRHVPIEFVPDKLTEQLVCFSIKTISEIYNRLSSNPTFIRELAHMFITDPDSTYGDKFEYTYYFSDLEEGLVTKE